MFKLSVHKLGLDSADYKLWQRPSAKLHTCKWILNNMLNSFDYVVELWLVNYAVNTAWSKSDIAACFIKTYN